MHAALVPSPLARVAVAVFSVFAALAVLPAAASAHDAILRDFPEQIVLPQRRSIPIRPLPVPDRVQVTSVDADVTIRDGVATTALQVHLFNPSHRRAEAVVLLPVPDAAVVRAFTFEGPGAESSARLLPRDEARRIYDAIVARSRDPALLEFAGLNVVRSSVFPVEPRGKQAVLLTFEQVLPADGDRRDYALPRSEAIDCDVPWTIRVRVQDRQSIGAIYSPSHEIETRRALGGENSRAEISLSPGAEKAPGAFLLSYLVARQPGPAATIFLHPDPKLGGGYFLLMAGVNGGAAAGSGRESRGDAGLPAPAARLPREVTIVLDRSGSMRGGKLDQAREAARQILAGLEPGERFHLIAYNEVVEACSDAPETVDAAARRRAEEFLEELTPRGGTNIHDALAEALRPTPADGYVPVVLFLTDGAPTVGPTSERVIRELATRGNPHQRRVFTFGVGAEINTPLLQSIALATRAAATFVLPGEDIEVKVASVFRRLAGPAMTSPRLSVRGDPEEPAPAAHRRITHVLPQPLPDLFAGDEMLVFGRYRGASPFTLALRGDSAGRPIEIRAAVDPAAATTRHSFVPRLWAARRIGVLTASLRELGGDATDHGRLLADPATRELIDEIVQLSTEFGILTEYTSFLAEEGSEMPAPAEARALTRREVQDKAFSARSGAAAVSQEANSSLRLQGKSLNARNVYFDEKLALRDVRTIQQIADLAFYRRDGRWIDSRLAAKSAAPSRVVEPGTAEHQTIVDQLVRERRQAAAALSGDVLLEVDGAPVLLRNSAPESAP